MDCKTEESTNLHEDLWTFLLLIRIECSFFSWVSRFKPVHKSYPIAGLLRPFQPQEFDASRISRKSAYAGAKVVSPTHRPPLFPGYLLRVLILVRGWVYPRAIVQPEGLSQWKIPKTPSGIEHAAFQLAAHWLSLCAYKYNVWAIS